jgi:hypothetical protein
VALNLPNKHISVKEIGEVSKIYEDRFIKGKIAVVIFLVIGIVFIVVGFPIADKPAYNYYELIGKYLLPMGAVIIFFVIIGAIVVFVPKKSIIGRSVTFMIFGIIVILMGIYLSLGNSIFWAVTGGVFIIPIGIVIIILAVSYGIIGLILSKSETSKKSRIIKIKNIISSTLCFVGGLLFIVLSIIDSLNVSLTIWAMYGFSLIIIGIFTIIGALAGIKYQLGGSLLCLILGSVSVLMMGLILRYVFGVLYGTILILTGSIGGLIGRKSKTV